MNISSFRLQFQITSVFGNKVDLVFYGDRTTANMFRTSLLPFDQGCALFIPGKRELLNKAVKEALMEKAVQSKSVN